MIIHFHYSLSPNSGDVKRISNIDREFTSYYKDNSVEVVFVPFRNRNKAKKDGEFKLSNNTVKKHYITLIPHSDTLNPIYESIILAYLCLRYRAHSLIGEMFFPKGMTKIVKTLCPKIKVFADIHGAAVEEHQYLNPSIEKKKIDAIRKTDEDTMHSADFVVCQSDEMKRYIISNYQVEAKKVVVYRCGYDAGLFKLDSMARNNVRRELGIKDNELLFVYSGGLHKWQKVEDNLKVFKNYHSQNPNSKMLILTGDTDKLNELLSKEDYGDIKRLIISTSVPFKSVPSYLNASDVAFLIRDNHMMNAVASPTKLAEYLACGLPVISSEVSKHWITEEASPYLIMAESENLNEDIDRAVATLNKDAISAYAFNNLSLDIDHNNITSFLSAI